MKAGRLRIENAMALSDGEFQRVVFQVATEVESEMQKAGGAGG
jgi:hypothetical protein